MIESYSNSQVILIGIWLFCFRGYANTRSTIDIKSIQNTCIRKNIKWDFDSMSKRCLVDLVIVWPMRGQIVSALDNLCFRLPHLNARHVYTKEAPVKASMNRDLTNLWLISVGPIWLKCIESPLMFKEWGTRQNPKSERREQSIVTGSLFSTKRRRWYPLLCSHYHWQRRPLPMTLFHCAPIITGKDFVNLVSDF